MDFNLSLPSSFGSMGSMGQIPSIFGQGALSEIPVSDMTNLNIPSIGNMAGSGQGGLFGLGAGGPQLALSGLGTIANIWSAFQAAKLAKKQFKFTKDVTNTNLNNQIQSYNTSLADRAKTRAVMEGRTSQSADEYIAANSARR